MSLDQTIQVLERAMEGKRIVRKSLRPKDISILAAFYSEKEKRPELTSLIEFPDLMYDYLRLDVEDRESLEELRQINPSYLEGDVCAIRCYELVIIQVTRRNKDPKQIEYLFDEIGLRNALPKIVEPYIKYQPVTRMGPVSLKSWFYEYDIDTGKTLVCMKDGRYKVVDCSKGNKYVNRWKRSNERISGVGFDEWLETKLKKGLIKKLKETLYFKEKSSDPKEKTLFEIVDAYITKQPKGRKGYVPLKAWFTSYNIESVAKVGNKADGIKYIGRWFHNRHSQKGIGFDEWIEEQLKKSRPDLLKRLKKSPNYQKKPTLFEVIEHYISNQKLPNVEILPLNKWFQRCDIFNGHLLKYMRNWKYIQEGTPQGNSYYFEWFESVEKKRGIKFEEWVERQLRKSRPDLLKKLKKSPYYMREILSIGDIVNNYITLQPKNQRGIVTLMRWVISYNVKSGEHLIYIKDGNKVRKSTPQGAKLWRRWLNTKERKNGIDFEEWVLNQVNPETRNRYISQVYGIRDSESIIRQLKNVLDGKKVKTDKNIGYLAAFYAEQEQHPEVIAQLKTPYQIMKYLSLSPEARTATDYRKLDPREKLICRTLPIS